MKNKEEQKPTEHPTSTRIEIGENLGCSLVVFFICACLVLIAVFGR